jgi:hypothetical protein
VRDFGIHPIKKKKTPAVRETLSPQVPEQSQASQALYSTV